MSLSTLRRGAVIRLLSGESAERYHAKQEHSIWMDLLRLKGALPFKTKQQQLENKLKGCLSYCKCLHFTPAVVFFLFCWGTAPKVSVQSDSCTCQREVDKSVHAFTEVKVYMVDTPSTVHSPPSFPGYCAHYTDRQRANKFCTGVG